MPDMLKKQLYEFLKNKHKNDHRNELVSDFINNDETIGKIIRSFDDEIFRSYIGLLETGDLIFLFANQFDSFDLLNQRLSFNGLKAKIYYDTNSPNVWQLELINDNFIDRNPEFKFHIPDRVIQEWRDFSMDKNAALNFKSEYFSRIFIFRGQQSSTELPFFVANIDRSWIDDLRDY